VSIFLLLHLVDNLIEYAEQSRASDIHISPRHDTAAGAYAHRRRVAGLAVVIPKNIHQEVISRIKVLAGLRTDEHAGGPRWALSRSDGERASRSMSVFLSRQPTMAKIRCLRLLANNAEEYSLTSLGFSEEDQKKIIKAIKRPHGMILSTGPTGSGKTTTLYTVIKMLNTPRGLDCHH
jgi:type IV pilus assembly protein PilB